MSRADVVKMAEAIVDMADEIAYLREVNFQLKMENERFREDQIQSLREYQTQFANIIDKALSKVCVDQKEVK